MDDQRGMAWKEWTALNPHGRYAHLFALVELSLKYIHFAEMHRMKQDSRKNYVQFCPHISKLANSLHISYTLLLFIRSQSKKDSFCSITPLTDGIFPAPEK